MWNLSSDNDCLHILQVFTTILGITYTLIVMPKCYLSEMIDDATPDKQASIIRDTWPQLYRPFVERKDEPKQRTTE